MPPIRLTLPAACLALVFLAGCAGTSVFRSHPQGMAPVVAALSEGRALDLRKSLKREARGRDELLYRLERGRLAQLQGDFDDSRREFARGIDLVRAADDRALVSAREAGGEAAAWLLNDNARQYAPPGYERVLLHHFQALDYLFARDLDGAAVEVRRANVEQEAARERYAEELSTAAAAARESRVGGGRVRGLEERFSVIDEAAAPVANSFQNAATFYLSGVVYEAMGEPGDAYIDYRKALEILPRNRYLQLDALRLADSLGMSDDLASMKAALGVSEGLSLKARDPGDGELVVLYDDGLVPPKMEVKFPVPLPGGGFGAVAFPIYLQGWAPPDPLHVGRFNIGTLSTEPVAYVDAMAARALKEAVPGLVVRHVIRTAGKAAAAAAALRSDKDLGPVAGLAVGLWNVISENADLRSWLTLPRDVQILRTTLPAGRHALSLRAGGGGATGGAEVEIRRGRITLLHVARTGTVLRARSTVLQPVAAGKGRD
jgi:hypothetical protein